jgi:hypothetical protein
MNNFFMPKGLTLTFMSKVKAPFLIVKPIFKDMYKLELLADIKVCLTFHVSSKNPFKIDTLWSDCKQVIGPPPDLIRGHSEYEVR